MGKNAPTFGEEMNYQPKSLSIRMVLRSVPMGSGELTPDKPIKKGERRNKTSGPEDDGGTVDEAGTSTFGDERMSASLEGPDRGANERKKE